MTDAQAEKQREQIIEEINPPVLRNLGREETVKGIVFSFFGDTVKNTGTKFPKSAAGDWKSA